MRAIIIDPFTQTVSETTIPDGSLKSIRTAVFGEDGTAPVTRSDLGGGIDIWLDDEGLMHSDRSQRFFAFNVHSPAMPMAGRGVMLAISRDGYSISLPAAISVDDVAKMVRFIGGDDELEAAIVAGEVTRPNSTIRSWKDGVESVTTMWEWQPSPAEESAASD